MTATPTWHDDSAFRHWQVLFVAVAPVVAVVALVQSVLELLGSGGQTAVVDGLPLVTPGWHEPVMAIVWALAWAYAVSAAMIAFRSTLLGSPVTAFSALRSAVGRWRAAVGVLLVMAVAFGACFLLAGVVAGFAGPLGFVVLAAAVFIPTQLVAALPVAVLDGTGVWNSVGQALRLAEGRRWRLFWLSVGMVLATLPAAWLGAALPDVTAGPITAALGRLTVAFLAVAGIAVQGAILARWRVQLDVERPAGSAPCPDRWLAACGGLAGAVLVEVALIAANPYGVPVLASSVVPDREPFVGYALTTDGAAISAKSWECWTCDSPPEPLAWDSHRAIFDGGAATVSAEHLDDRDVRLTWCTGHTCTTQPVKLNRPGGFWEHWALRAMPDGGLLVVALVTEQGDIAGSGTVVGWICPDRTCQTSRRVVLASSVSVQNGPFSTVHSMEAFTLTAGVGANGRPAVAFSPGSGTRLTVVRCADHACSQRSEEYGILLGLGHGDGDATPVVVGLGFDPGGQVVAVLAGHPQPAPARLHVQVGRAAQPRVISVTCADDRCERHATRAWNEVDPDAWGLHAWPVTLPDGRPALIEEDSQGARLIACERNCAP
jgi:hypothetical protein